jgi:hypothetical protein
MTMQMTTRLGGADGGEMRSGCDTCTMELVVFPESSTSATLNYYDSTPIKTTFTFSVNLSNIRKQDIPFS